MDLSLRPVDHQELIALLDLLPNPSVLALNPACSSVHTNRAFNDLVGRPYTYMRDGRELQSDELPMCEAIRTGAELRDVHLELVTDDGRIIYLHGSVAPLRDAQGTVSASLATFVDVSEMRRLQHELDAARDEERRLASDLAYLSKAGQELSESLDPRAVLDTLGRIVVPRLAECVTIALAEDGKKLGLRHVHHSNRDVEAQLAAFLNAKVRAGGIAFTLSESVMRTGRTIVVEDLRAYSSGTGMSEEYREFMREATENFSLHRAAAIPMKNRGELTGVFVAVGGKDQYLMDEDVRMLEELGRRAASAIENARSFERQRHFSQTLQTALLPPHIPRLKTVHFDTAYMPGDDEAQIGGDWYDTFQMPDGRIAVSIGDVTGRGVEAAVIMSKVRHSLKALTLYEADPTRLLNGADAILRDGYPDAIVTALVGILDLKNGTFSYATAGHPPPMLRRSADLILQLPCHGLPLGLRTEDEPRAVCLSLCEGDLIVLYTDGLLESTHDLREGERRITMAIADLNEETIAEAAHAIRAEVLYDGSRDDVAILTMQVRTMERSCPRDTMEWSFDASDARLAHESRAFLLLYLLAQGVPAQDFSGAELIFGELIGNVVRHAAGPVRVRVDWSGQTPVLYVTDEGTGFDLDAVLPDDPMSEVGRGLFLINALTADFSVRTLQGGGNEARAVLPIQRM